MTAIASDVEAVIFTLIVFRMIGLNMIADRLPFTDEAVDADAVVGRVAHHEGDCFSGTKCFQRLAVKHREDFDIGDLAGSRVSDRHTSGRRLGLHENESGSDGKTDPDGESSTNNSIHGKILLLSEVVTGLDEAGGRNKRSAVIVGPAALLGSGIEEGGGQSSDEEVGLFAILATTFVLVQWWPEFIFVKDLMKFAKDEAIRLLGINQPRIGTEVVEQALDFRITLERGVRLEKRVMWAVTMASLMRRNFVDVIFAEGAIDKERVGHQTLPSGQLRDFSRTCCQMS